MFNKQCLMVWYVRYKITVLQLTKYSIATNSIVTQRTVPARTTSCAIDFRFRVAPNVTGNPFARSRDLDNNSWKFVCVGGGGGQTQDEWERAPENGRYLGKSSYCPEGDFCVTLGRGNRCLCVRLSHSMREISNFLRISKFLAKYNC